MTKYDNLNDNNFLIYAIKHYDNPQCASTEEFYEDLNRIKYLKKLFTRYETSGVLQEKLIINHLVILNNVFGATPLIRILALKMNGQLKYLKPFFIMMEIWPEVIYNIGPSHDNINTDIIPMDKKIVNILRKI
ncbi:MAG TPA: hypothetical protein VIY47_08370 [Ignavibacteriaceae bacterium]